MHRDPRSSGIVRELISFSLPLILSGVLQQLYLWADAFIVGNVEGEGALAAIGATTTLMNFFLLLVIGFTGGLSILFARSFGAGETEDIPRLLSTWLLVLGVASLVLAAAGFALTPWLLRLMHTTADTLSMAEDYLAIIFLGLPFLTVYNVCSAALRGIGDSQTPFRAICVSSGANVVLDLAFVWGLRWGVAGAAWATVLSQAAMAVFLVVYVGRKHPFLRPALRRPTLHRELLRPGTKLGVPPMIQSGINAFGGILLQDFMNSFGTATVAAITTAYRVDCIALLPIINLGTAISTLTAQSHGAGDLPRTRKVLSAGSGLMTAVSLSLSMLVVALGGFLVAMFGVGPEAALIGREFFRCIGPFYLLFGLSTALRGYTEGLGDMVFSSGAGIFSLGCRIVLSYRLAHLWGNMVIAYAEAISWGVLLLLYLLRTLWLRRRTG